MARKKAKYNPYPLTVEQLDRVRAYMLALPIKKSNRFGSLLPYGYKLSKEDPNLLEPIPEYFKALVSVKRWIDTGAFTFREASEWISLELKDYISPANLRFIFETRCPDPRCLLPLEERLEI